MKVPLNAIALCCCVQIERRWNRCTVSIGSPVATVIRGPNSLMNLRPAVFTRPNDSMAMGMKLCITEWSAYFVTFHEAASSAALPADVQVKRLYDVAHVWMLVKSQFVYLPLDHGTSVIPSGLFPTVRRRPGGSLELGMSALKSDLQMMSFIAKWQLAHAPDCLHTSPWWPLGSVVLLNWHWCGAQRFRPRQRLIATRTAALLSPKPQEAIGTLKSQSPTWGADTASNLAWSSGSLFEDQTKVIAIAIRGTSQVFCLVSAASSPPGNVNLRASRISFSNLSSHTSWSVMAAQSDLVDAADAR